MLRKHPSWCAPVPPAADLCAEHADVARDRLTAAFVGLPRGTSKPRPPVDLHRHHAGGIGIDGSERLDLDEAVRVDIPILARLGVVFILLSGGAWTLTQFGRDTSGRDD